MGWGGYSQEVGSFCCAKYYLHCTVLLDHDDGQCLPHYLPHSGAILLGGQTFPRPPQQMVSQLYNKVYSK